MKRGTKPGYYSVYRYGSDEPVIIHATARECARVMGITVSTFYGEISLQRKRVRRVWGRWQIFRDDEPEDDQETDKEVRV